MAEPLFDDDDERPASGRDGLFWWTILILLLIGAALACWMGSFYIFGHPEEAKSYKILKKLGKIEQPRRFEVTAAPPGEFLGAQKSFERYSRLTSVEQDRENAELLRIFIRNYKDTKKLVPYVAGRFTILKTWELKGSDVFDSGVVALAQSADFPQVLIEHVYTASPKNVPMLMQFLQTGLDIKIERTLDLSAVLNIERITDGRMLITAVPLLYGTYALKGGAGTFGLIPPEALNLEAGFPVLRADRIQDGVKTYAEWRRARGQEAEPAGQPARTELVRLDAIPQGTKPPEQGELPEMPIAKATVVQRGTPAPATPMPIAIATPAAIIRPPATPAIAAAITPDPVKPVMTAPGVPLKPFLASNPAPGLPDERAKGWQLYTPGQLPAGNWITANDMGGLAERGDLGEKLYLSGKFRVSASGENRAVLRPDSGAASDDSVRIIAEFPAGAIPPAEGGTFERDNSRAFQIRDVRRGADGQLNVYVREIIKPQ